eukprot:SAG31_NODE_829_length_11709_cov_5.435917_6_plen_147_part_00
MPECQTLLHIKVAPQTVVPVLRCIPEHWLPWYTKQIWEVRRQHRHSIEVGVGAGRGGAIGEEGGRQDHEARAGAFVLDCHYRLELSVKYVQKALAILQDYLRLKITGGRVVDTAHGPSKAEGVVFAGEHLSPVVAVVQLSPSICLS